MIILQYSSGKLELKSDWVASGLCSDSRHFTSGMATVEKVCFHATIAPIVEIHF